MSDPVNLQRDWDRLLIQNFYSADTVKMFLVAKIFKGRSGMTDEQFNELKRIPRLPQHNNVYTRRFVCAFLPKISDILWKHKPEELETLADAMCKIKYDTLKNEWDYDKVNKDRHAISYSKTKMKQALLVRAAAKRVITRFNKNQTWDVTK